MALEILLTSEQDVHLGQSPYFEDCYFISSWVSYGPQNIHVIPIFHVTFTLTFMVALLALGQ